MPPKNQHGGYRRPTNPAPASGPGALSRRTDGKQPAMALPNAAYGEQAAFRAAQSAGAMAQATPTPGGPPGPPQGLGGAAAQNSAPPVNVTPFGDPTANPDQPVTAGAAAGPGVGPQALGLPPPDPQVQMDQNDARRLVEYLPVFEYMSSQPGASDSLRTYVRQIRTMAQQ